MIEFNSDNIIVGYIKQLLHSFNLPTIPVYDENKLFEGQYLIKDNHVVAVENNTLVNKFTYMWNYRILPNLTQHLEINSLTYDSETHEYLGRYLRFLRDYKKLDLMPLYNCFSDKLVDDFSFGRTLAYKESDVIDNVTGDAIVTEDDQPVSVQTEYTTFKVDFVNSDEYKIYAIPVTFGKKYTIAIDSNFPIDIICGFYSSKPYNIDKDIYKNTYQTIQNTRFNKPFVYDKLANYTLNKTLVEHEKNLKLYIKIPANNKSSIVILEGDYTSCNTHLIKNRENSEGIPLYNSEFIINWENTDFEELNKKVLPANLQLLTINSNKSYPFSDKLLEYLLDNVISSTDDIEDNILRLQQALKEKKIIKSVGLHEGEWEDRYKYLLYEFARKNNVITNSFDILGYVDKDIEKKLNIDTDIYGD